eukprot:7328909-Prymnesium_polylepis.1
MQHAAVAAVARRRGGAPRITAARGTVLLVPRAAFTSLPRATFTSLPRAPFASLPNASVCLTAECHRAAAGAGAR